MQFLSLDIYNGKYLDFLESIKTPKQKTLVFTPNPEMLLRAGRDPGFLDILRQADTLTPDANGLYTASLIQEGSGFLSACFQTFFMRK
jgi:UDP-N-acetyl-D-mannosaminuronic acid transferase (WecB/TagA/CpsF family)